MIKIIFYNLSLLPLYVIYFIETVDVYMKKESILNFSIYVFKVNLDYRGILFLILIFMSLISLIFVRNYLLKGSKNKMIVIQDIRKKNYDYFTFLSVFILPLFGIDLKTIKDLIVLFFILLFMGFVYIKGNFLYLNPIYLIFGWHLYEGFHKENKIIFLSDDENIKNEIEKGYIIKRIDKDFYFVKKADKWK